MPSVSIKEGKIFTQKAKIPFLCGEFHYWRIDPLYWDRVLDAIEELGLPLIASYICWEFHQVGEGAFDFTGKTHPRRNLKKFLDLVRKRGFKLFIRPGPYIYSEWKNLGIPDAAARVHRLDPAFLKLAQRYMRAVTKLLLPYLATRGGPIVLFQADNEIDPIPGAFEEGLGFSGKPGPLHSFLKSKYGKIEKLNEAWGTRYRSFSQAKAATANPGLDSQLWRRFYDTREFVTHYSTEKARWMIEEYRNLGINVPFVFNTYAAFESQNWRDLEKVGDLAGVDLYPENELSGGRESQRLFMERVRAMRTYSKAPFIVEFESGLWHGFIHQIGHLKPNHYRLCALSALSAGAVGWNWYMLVNRDNWYEAPINELGEPRPELYSVFKELVQTHRELQPADLTKLADAAVSFSYAHYRSGFSPETDPVLRAFYEADLDYEFCDLETGQVEKPFLFYSGEEWLPRREQQTLLEYVKKGGTLVLFQKGPRFDENRQLLNLLELPQPEAILGGKEVLSHKKYLCVELDKNEKPLVSSEVHLFSLQEKGQLIWARQAPSTGWELQWKLLDGERYPAGIILKRGKGKIILLGVLPNRELLHSLSRFLGIQTYATSSPEGIYSALFQRKGKQEFFLILTNNSSQPIEARTRLSLPHPIRAAELLLTREKVPLLSSAAGQHEVLVPVPAKSGCVVKLLP